MESFQIGPLTIKYVWLYLLTALFFAYIVMDMRMKKESPDVRKVIFNLLSNSLMIILVSYKFSFILFRPSIMWENPIGIIYFTGGMKGIVLGGVISMIYLAWRFKVSNLDKWSYWKSIVYGFVTFMASYYIVQTIFSLLI